MMNNTDVIEHFFGVYLLYCTNPRYEGRTYIGYTANPNRRIKQHNAGKQSGGAKKTSDRGPWEMVLIVHGFPNKTSALRFEWAWQHPGISRRLKHVPRKIYSKRTFKYCLMVLSEMLMVGPWCRLPLTIRWLDDQFGRAYASTIIPPLHMSVSYGKVIPRKLQLKKQKKADEQFSQKSDEESLLFCFICGLIGEKDETVSCIKPSCLLVAHLICLAQMFCKDDKIIPIEGTCPACNTNVLWGDLIRKMIGCNQNVQEVENDNSSSSSDNDNSSSSSDNDNSSCSSDNDTID